VYRVLARLFGIETDIATHQAKTEFMLLANQLVSSDRPDLYNQAIMEFGAMQCTHASPDCLLCPFQQECEAFLTGRQAQLPVKIKKVTVRNRFFHYVVFIFQGKIAMRHRTGKDIWQGLYDFPAIETDAPLETGTLLQMPEFLALAPGVDIPENSIPEMSRTYIHVLTHQRVEARFLKIQLETPPANVRFYGLEQAWALPKPILIDKYLNEHFF